MIAHKVYPLTAIPPESASEWTVEDLQTPTIYEHPFLGALCRHIAKHEYENFGRGKMGRGEFKRRLQDGKYPQLVQAYLHTYMKQRGQIQAQRQASLNAWNTLSIPPALSVERDGEWLYIRGPWDKKRLGNALKKHGAWWEHRKKHWKFPLGNAGVLQGIFNDWSQWWDAQAQPKTHTRKKSTPKRDQHAIPARKNYQFRMKVEAGLHKTGDTLKYQGREYHVVNTGRVWEEKHAPHWGQHGVRYDERCPGCGHVTQIDNEIELCEKCSSTETYRVCYAYLA